MQRDEKVRDLAYRIWESRGRPHAGSAEEDWLEAERQVPQEPPVLTEEAIPAARSTDETLKASFPASDPPASQLPDNPPANAAAKWKASAAAETPESPKRPATRRRPAGAGSSKSAD